MNRAVFLDRDGVLIKTNVINGKPFAIRALSELQIFNEALSQLNRLKQINFLLIVVTNQPDIKMGLTSMKTQKSINNKLIEHLPIDLIKICAELEEECSGNYKPQPGMLLEASEELNIDLKNSYIIGDRWRDIGAGYNAGTKTILIDYKYSEKLIYEPDFYAHNLSEAVDVIINNESI